jgi:hypothetical protein
MPNSRPSYSTNIRYTDGLVLRVSTFMPQRGVVRTTVEHVTDLMTTIKPYTEVLQTHEQPRVMDFVIEGQHKRHVARASELRIRCHDYYQPLGNPDDLPSDSTSG